jgi:hypothetical protein
MLTEVRQQITDKGYKIVAETEDGVSFVNEDTQICVMLLNYYDDLSNKDKDHGHELHKTLTEKYQYANKCTICVIIDSPSDKEAIQRNEYYFVKIFSDRINIIPSSVNKAIKITFEPMVGACDFGDYTINAFEPIDGLTCANFYSFLSSVTKNSVVKYPKCISTSYFRFMAHKLFAIETIN